MITALRMTIPSGNPNAEILRPVRSYVFGVITPKVCLYYHSLERNSDIPKYILLDNEISKDCFVEFDAFYRKMFSIKADNRR